MGLSLAEQLDVDDLTPGAIFESVEDLQARTFLSSSQGDLDSTDSATLNSHSINQLSTLIRLLSEALSNKQKHHRPTPDLPVVAHQQNSTQPKTSKPVKPAKNSQPASSKFSNQSENSERKLSNRSIEAEAEVNRAIDAIIDFNNQPDLAHNDKWHIGVGALRKLTQRGDTVTKRVLEQRAEQIQQHHAQHQIGPHHNSKGKEYPSIHEIISL